MDRRIAIIGSGLSNEAVLAAVSLALAQHAHPGDMLALERRGAELDLILLDPAPTPFTEELLAFKLDSVRVYEEPFLGKTTPMQRANSEQGFYASLPRYRKRRKK